MFTNVTTSLMIDQPKIGRNIKYHVIRNGEKNQQNVASNKSIPYIIDSCYWTTNVV